jgi:membrane protein DedA with SNARE-associated domain
MSHFLIQLVTSGGIVMIFVLMAGESAGLPISSEIVVPLGGYLAAQHHLDFTAVVAASSLGNLAGSLAAYWLTRRYGEAFVLGPGRRIGLHAGHLALANRFFDRFGLAAVFIGRLLPIVRTYISFPAGVTRIRTVPFIIATILGAIPWNFGLAYAGLKLGQNWEHIAKVMGPFTILAAILVLAALVGLYLLGKRLGEESSLTEVTATAPRE